MSVAPRIVERERMVLEAARRGFGGGEPARKRMAHVVDPDHLIARADHAFDGHVGNLRNRELEYLAVGTESDGCGFGRQAMRDHSGKQGGRAAGVSRENLFERGTLFAGGAAIDVDGECAAALRHLARRGERLHGVKAREVDLAVGAVRDMRSEDDVAMALRRPRLCMRKKARAQQFAVARFEVFALDMPAFRGAPRLLLITHTSVICKLPIAVNYTTRRPTFIRRELSAIARRFRRVARAWPRRPASAVRSLRHLTSRRAGPRRRLPAVRRDSCISARPSARRPC